MSKVHDVDSLRAAIARVLVAPGEAPDAMKIEERWSHGGARIAVSISARHLGGFSPSLSMWCAPDDGSDPIEAAWAEIVRRLEQADERAQKDARRARAALDAAEESGQ